MNLLALDTSTDFLSLALQVGDKTFTHTQQAGTSASEFILPQIQALLDEAKVSLKDLDGIAFGAPKKHLTRIFFFIVIPLAASAFYLQLITGLMESFREAPAREKLLECKTPEKMWQVLNQLTKKSIA